jgi:hypothetical protein
MNRRTTLVLAAALLVVPAFAADPPGFALWKSAELKQRDEALSKKVGPDHSARETLADYNDHRSGCSIGMRTVSPSSTTT